MAYGADSSHHSRNLFVEFNADLTYMSIGELLQAAQADGRLRLLKPRLGGAVVRPLFVTEDVWSELHAEREDDAERAWWRGQRAVLDLFSSGERMVCPTQICPLDPQSDGVWEIKAAQPIPPLRFFGRFAEFNVYVCTNFERRDALEQFANGRNWRDERVRCCITWRQLLHPYEPLTGDSIHDYAANLVDIRTIRQSSGARHRRRRILSPEKS